MQLPPVISVQLRLFEHAFVLAIFLSYWTAARVLSSANPEYAKPNYEK